MYIQCIHVVQIGYFNDFYMYICLVLLEKGTSNKNTYCVYTVFVYVYQVRSLYCIYMYLHIACTVYTVFVYIHVYQVRSLYLYTKITLNFVISYNSHVPVKSRLSTLCLFTSLSV